MGEPHGNLQDPDDPRWVVLAALQWRWAVRLGEPLKGRLSAVNEQRWMRVQPLVEQAWAAPDTARVYDLAEQIAAILGLRQPLAEAMLLLLTTTRGRPRRRRRAPSESGRGLDRPGRPTRPGRSPARSARGWR